MSRSKNTPSQESTTKSTKSKTITSDSTTDTLSDKQNENPFSHSTTQETEYKPGEISSTLFDDDSTVNKMFDEKRSIPERKRKEAIPTVSLESNEEDLVEEPVEEKDTYKTRQQLKEESDRSIFVGNVPVSKDFNKQKKLLARHFQGFGIESIRFRGIPLLDTKQPRKAAVYNKKLSDLKSTMIAYIVFKTIEEVDKAIAMNRSLFQEHHLIIDHAETKKLTRSDYKKAIFIGNVPFDAEEEELFRAFTKKGVEPERVRLVRDKHNSMGKGFGFILFQDSASAKKAVGFGDKFVKIRDRHIRITHANQKIKKKEDAKKQRAEERKSSKSEKKDDSAPETKTPWKVVNQFDNKQTEPFKPKRKRERDTSSNKKKKF